MVDGRTKGVRNPTETRRKLIATAADLFHRKRFQGCGIQEIYTDSGVTRGALFHHFKDKSTLGVAVIDGPVRDWIDGVWVSPLETSTDAVETVKRGLEMIRERGRRDGVDGYLTFGCPFAALVSEMAALDEQMAEALRGLHDRWLEALVAGLQRDKDAGRLHASIRPEDEAAMIVGAVSGLATMQTLTPGEDSLERGFRALEAYLETLKV